MNVNLEKEDLINLICSISPHKSVYNNEIIKGLGDLKIEYCKSKEQYDYFFLKLEDDRVEVIEKFVEGKPLPKNNKKEPKKNFVEKLIDKFFNLEEEVKDEKLEVRELEGVSKKEQKEFRKRELKRIAELKAEKERNKNKEKEELIKEQKLFELKKERERNLIRVKIKPIFEDVDSRVFWEWNRELLSNLTEKQLWKVYELSKKSWEISKLFPQEFRNVIPLIDDIKKINPSITKVIVHEPTQKSLLIKVELNFKYKLSNEPEIFDDGFHYVQGYTNEEVLNSIQTFFNSKNTEWEFAK